MARIETYPANPAGRDFVVGDIHGCFGLLDVVLEHVEFNKQCDRLFSVGDLIDRGPSSSSALEYLAKPWLSAVRGNHEQMLVDACTPGPRQSEHRRLWAMNGGQWFESLPIDAQETFAARLAELPYVIEVALADGQRAGVVHADVINDDWSATLSIAGHSKDAARLTDLLWSRDRVSLVDNAVHSSNVADRIAVAGIDVVHFGHTPLGAPTRVANTRWLDTGAVFGNTLCIAELGPMGQVWRVAADSRAVTPGWA